MPKIKKKPTKKAVVRAQPGKKTVAKRPRAVAKTVAKKAAKRSARAAKTKVKLAPAAKVKPKTQARVAAPRTLILPPKAKRKVGRVAPPPPRTPSVLTLSKELEQPLRLAPLAKAQ